VPSTKEPAPAIVGAAPQDSDCPGDHPIKGNIRDQNPNKGEKIYRVQGDNGFAKHNLSGALLMLPRLKRQAFAQ
jgi:hypothetical protein